MHRFPSQILFLSAAAAVALALPACQTAPSHSDILFYHRQHELIAAEKLSSLRSEYEKGEISKETYRARAEEIARKTPEEAMMALYRDQLLATRTAPAPPAR